MRSEDLYSIEDMYATFCEHHKRHKKHHDKLVEDFKISYPNEPLPDHLKDEFSLPKALASICFEIMKTVKE